MPIIEGLVQQTPEWLAMRCGMVTGSRVADVMAVLKRKDAEAAARRNYRYEIAIETLTGRAADSYVSPAMEWGIENEPVALAAYEIATESEVDAIGFAIHDRIPRFGASPDGLIGADGVLEIKCPTSAVHIDYVLAGVVPEDYQPQMLAEMACTGRQWCDFVSFDPRLPKPLQLFVRRFLRDEQRIGEMEQAVEQFLADVLEMLTRLTNPQALTELLQRSVAAVSR